MTPVPPSLDRFGDELHRAAVRELSTDSRPARSHARLLRRPRVLAGGSLGLAGVGAALVVALSAGGAAAPPAFAVTRASDGTVIVHLSSPEGISGAERKLASMGISETFSATVGIGKPVAGPVTCTPAPGASGPTVRVVMDSGGVPDAGGRTFRLTACYLHSGTSGNSGSGNTGAGHSGAGARTAPKLVPGPDTGNSGQGTTGNSGAGGPTVTGPPPGRAGTGNSGR